MLEHGGDCAIVFYIPPPLLFPVFCVVSWSRVPAIMPVPEAPVDKNRNMAIQKHKIRMTFNFIIASPSCNVMRLKELNQLDFSAFIPRGLNLPHDSGTIFF